MTDQESEELAEKIATKVKEKLAEPNLTIHILEHEATGHGLVINPAKARATSCKCFEYEGEEYCWSEGVLGLMSSKKNPEQIAEYCAKGKEPAGAGVARRFEEIKRVASEAHSQWQEKGGGLPGWWQEIGKKASEAGVEL